MEVAGSAFFHVEGRYFPLPRSGHVAVFHRNHMIIWGGYQEEAEDGEHYLPSDEIWFYDTLVDKWYVHIINRGDWPDDTSGSRAAVVDETLYIVCGHGNYGNVNTVSRINMKKWVWERIECGRKGPSPRDKFSIWEYENNLYIFGGFGIDINGFLNGDGTFFPDSTVMWGIPRGWNNQVLVFNTETCTWTNPVCKGTAPSPRAAHDSVRVGTQVYTFGGRHDRARLNDMHCLDLDSMTWSGSLPQQGMWPEGRSWHTLTKISNSLLFLYGGFNQNNQPLSDSWTFNVVTHQWKQLHFAHAVPRLWHTACVAPDGDVIVFGGCSNNILNQEEVNMHCSDLLRFRCTPATLFRLSLEVTCANKERNFKEWETLPKILYSLLMQRSGYSIPGVQSGS